jgi:Tfp pilus assembly protein PilX
MLNGTCHLNHQRGFATLLTSLIILVGITLITLFTARTTLMEQRMSANHYRSSQAFYAAQAALEIGIGYINQYGTANLLGKVFPPSGDPLLLEYPFNNDATLELKSPTNPTNCYQLIATGKSDDQIGIRTISQCVTTLDISRGGGPEQPLISRSSVSLTGNASVINRYGNTTIWSGDPVTLGNSNSIKTYIREAGTPLSASTAVLESTDSTVATQIISSSNLGIGFDIIESDPALSGLTAEDFFDNTFVLSRDQIKTLAQNAGQLLPASDIADIDGLTGLIWIEGDSSLSVGDIGTSTQPAIVIFNGNARITGNPTIHGLAYVRGQLKVSGTVSVVGASVIEGDPSLVPAGQDPVIGNGTINQVFAPSLLQNTNKPPLPGLTVAVAGTWKDWP